MSTERFTNREKADCAEREVRQRLRVYPNLVATNVMTNTFAAKQIAVMRAIAADYARLAEEDESKERLL